MRTVGDVTARSPGPRLSRSSARAVAVLLLVALALLGVATVGAATAAAQSRSAGRAVRPQAPGRSAPPRNPAPPPPAAVWDSLFRKRGDAQLGAALAAWPDQAAPLVRLYRGLLAHAAGDEDAAITFLAPITDTAATTLTPQQLVAGARALGGADFALFRYRESGEAYRVALRRGAALDTATRAELLDGARLGEVLAGTPPQRIRWNYAARYDTVAIGGAPFTLRVRVGDDTAPVTFLATTGVPITVVSSSVAVRARLTPLHDTVRAVLPDGRTIRATPTVIPSLRLGPATLVNAVALIVPDSALPNGAGGAPRAGALGLPVFVTLGNVTFTPAGRVALNAPGTIPEAFQRDSGMTLGLTGAFPVLHGMVGDSAVAMVLDTRSPHSWIRQHTVAGATPNGLDVVAPFRMHVGAHDVVLDSITVLGTGAAPGGIVGALGQDAVAGAGGVTLDFLRMRARLLQPPLTVLPQLVYPTTSEATSSTKPRIPQEVKLLGLLLALFVVPKLLQRWRLPTAVTSLVMGVGANMLGLFPGDATIRLLATFGIVALFLFAGLDIDAHELRRHRRALGVYVGIWTVGLALATVLIALAFHVSGRAALLIALALLTPSTGFILSSLPNFGLEDGQRFAVKTFGIGSELLALGVLFFTLQSTSPERLALSLLAMAAIVVVIPLAFRLFARLVAPYAPRSEFAFLLMVAVLSAYATWQLGVYYLVGAFIVGVAAQRFREQLPSMSSEKMVDALEAFGSVFIPFYFFRAGMEISRDQLTLVALGLGVALTAVLVPIRVAAVALQRRAVAHEPLTSGRRVGLALVPTLVFTLVICELLHDRFGVGSGIIGGLVLYTVINTTIPALILHSPPPEFENVEAGPVDG